MAKRTKAQRRAAALASWERRRKGHPPVTPQKSRKRKRPAKAEIVRAFDTPLPVSPPEVRYISQPRIAYVVREGADIFVCFAHDGSINREKISRETALKLLRDLSAAIA